MTIEQNLTVSERLKQQKKYSYTSNDGKKYFIVRWKQTVTFHLIELY